MDSLADHQPPSFIVEGQSVGSVDALGRYHELEAAPATSEEEMLQTRETAEGSDPKLPQLRWTPRLSYFRGSI